MLFVIIKQFLMNIMRYFLKGIAVNIILIAPVLGVGKKADAQYIGMNYRDTTSITTAFDPESNEWKVQWPGSVSQYDVVYQSPPIDPMQGIPLGNGDVGALFWCEDSKIIVVINKSDLWDDAEFGRFKNHGKQEQDHSTTQRHAFRIVMDFKLPLFSTMYLSDFKAKLHLADASLTLEAKSPFGKISFISFIDHATGVLFYDFKSDLTEDVPVDIILERYGSRTFSNWFNQVNRDASIGLTGTETMVGARNVTIIQKLSGGTFAGGGAVIHSNNLGISCVREHSRSGFIRLTGSNQKEAKLAFGATSPVDGDPIPGLSSIFSLSESEVNATYSRHAEKWRSIWSRSFMDYGDDYLNNLWYLTIYYLNASQGGKYPGRFVNGLWGWSRDVQNWNFYYHWNQQQLYWPLNAAGFHELVQPYLEYRFNSLPNAKKDAREFFQAEGAYISDVTERRGYNSLGEKFNHTPVAQIALDFWRQYRYTNDRTFLIQKAQPFIVEAARFFESLFEIGEDGLYYPGESTGYEGWIVMKNGLTDISHAKAIFSVAIEASKAAKKDMPEIKKWRHILEHLAPLPVVEADTAMVIKTETGFQLNRGFFKGKPVPINKILAAGWGIKENTWLTAYEAGDEEKRYRLKLVDGIFPSVSSAPVFPAAIIGLEQKGTPLFDKVKTTILLYGLEITGWDPVPVALARLGLKKALEKDLEFFPGRWQIYNNGWGHWGLEHDVYGKDYHQLTRDAEWFFRTYEVQDINSNEKFPLRMWPFRYTSMEAMSVLSTAMNESLLQSYDGTLRFFPAFPDNRTGRFTLHAEGGFVVSSEIKSGEVQWISVKSLFGNTCRLELPWSKATARSNKFRKNRILNRKIVEIKTMPGEIIQLLPTDKRFESFVTEAEEPSVNENVKYHSSGKARLGIPRMF